MEISHAIAAPPTIAADAPALDQGETDDRPRPVPNDKSVKEREAQRRRRPSPRPRKHRSHALRAVELP